MSVFLEDVGSRQGVRGQGDGRGRAGARVRGAEARATEVTGRSVSVHDHRDEPEPKALSISAAPRPRNSSFWRGTRESDRCSAVVAGEARDDGCAVLGMGGQHSVVPHEVLPRARD